MIPLPQIARHQEDRSMRFRRALILCTAAVLAMGAGVALDSRRADAASRRAVASAAAPFAPVPMHAWGPDMAGANRVPSGQAILPVLPGG